jgi:aldehyde:ferredoxin oxidoreductase
MSKQYGYAGKILRINLSNNRIWAENTEKYEKFIGGRGIAAKIAWNELKPNIDPLSSQNKLIFMTGPLTGILSPGSGRTCVAGIAPQVYPKPWYTRSNIGGRFGSELKYSGFDGIVVEGSSEKPVYIFIHDEGNVEILDADELWGLDTFTTQKMLMKKHGRDSVSICIGPAGENLVRTAVILTESGDAAGQGGFGAVMGSKKLKAISISNTRGSVGEMGVIKVADPKRLLELWKKALKLLQGGPKIPEVPSDFLGMQIKYERKYHACTHACPGLCGRGRDYGSFIWKNVPSKRYYTIESGQMRCIAPNFVAFSTEKEAEAKIEYRLSFPEALVLKNLCDKLGINQWDFLGGLILWLEVWRKKKLINETSISNQIDLNNPDFWMKLLYMIANREGFGSMLADGVLRTVENLGKANEYVPYVTCGFAEHGAGRGVWGFFEYPFWIVGALLWATDSRDPFSDTGHAYARLVYGFHYVLPLKDDQVKSVAKKIWGSEKAVTDDYEYKSQVAIWLQNRGCLTSSLPTCDWALPIVASNFTVDGSGDTSLESQLYSAVTGINYSEEELDTIGERIFNLERAIAIREGRNREVDERVVPFFKRPNWTRMITLDEHKFKMILDEYYELRGWDTRTGWPLKSVLEKLDLADVANELYNKHL